jgi:hypothetical protein
MPIDLQTIYAWLIANPEIWVPILVYVCWNVIPRQPPTDRRLFALWSVGERLMVLGWDRWGGNAKALGVVSPDPAGWADEAVTKKEPR